MISIIVENEKLIRDRVRNSILKQSVSLDLSGLKLKVVPEILREAKHINKLNISNNPITSLPEWLEEFTELESLDCKDCKLQKLFNGIYKLKKLKTLFLSNNYLVELPMGISDLECLIFLSANNNKITHLPKWVFNIESTFLEGNPVVDPPLEIFNRGVLAVKNYLREKEKGIEKIFEAKLLIVGEPGAGKTSLTKKIINENYQLTEESSTKGIEIIPYHFGGKSNSNFRINIWDFGGQEIYHTTHQFFLTKRSLYILLADNRAENTDFNYWLQTVELLSENSPVIILLNEKQNRKKEINAAGMRERFPNLKQKISFNLKSSRKELKKLKDFIHYEVQNLPHIGDELPVSWVEIRNKLENKAKEKPFITDVEYFEICDKIGDFDKTKALFLSDYLHDIGVILHFKDNPILKRIIILKPDWGTQAVYKILDDENIIEANGYFTKEDLDRMWNEQYYNGMHDELIALMMKFELCYTVEEGQKYIAPQLLKLEKPQYSWNKKKNTTIKYEYEFMPKGIITRFIVRMESYIESQKLTWREGVILNRHNKSRAEVIQTYGRREIIINVEGEQKKELLAIIIDQIDKINRSYKNIKVKKFVPCNCKECLSYDDRYYHDFETLERYVSKGKRIKLCDKSLEEINISSLLDDTFGTNLKLSSNEIEVYIAFSKKDRDLKNDLLKHLAPVKKELNLVYWDHEMVEAGENEKNLLFEHINKAKIVFLLLTPDYLFEASENSFEIDKIAEKHQIEDGIVIPILLRECILTNTNYFKTIKPVSIKGVAIYPHSNLDQAYVEAAMQINNSIVSHLNLT